MSRVSKLSSPSSTIGILASAAATIAAMTAYNVYRTRKVEREHPPVGQFHTVNGVRLHYIERGEGTPVVLLHGNVVTSEDQPSDPNKTSSSFRSGSNLKKRSASVQTYRG